MTTDHAEDVIQESTHDAAAGLGPIARNGGPILGDADFIHLSRNLPRGSDLDL